MEELRAYFYNDVFMAYHRYREMKDKPVMKKSMDRRAAINAAVALYHFREHLPDVHRRSRAQLSSLCPDYGLLGDIVNAAKHNVLSRGSPQITKADDIYEIYVSTRYKDEEGEYNHLHKLVEVKLFDGSVRDVFEILTNVVNLWHDELHRIGAMERREPIQVGMQGIILREDACQTIELGITKELQWKQNFKIQKYNYETNKIEPIDLSDASEIRFTIKKPQKYEIVLSDNLGNKIIKMLELTIDQSVELNLIPDEDQRDQFLWTVAEEQGIVEQMKNELIEILAREADK